MPCQGQNGCKMGRMYLTPPSRNGRIYFQKGSIPTINKFYRTINSGFLTSATLQSAEQYNRIHLIAASPHAKVEFNKENPDGSVICNAGQTTCANCCLEQPQFDGLVCGCNCNTGPANCCYCN